MTYTLTLTKQERRAFDFVGDSYNAHDVARLLRLHCCPDYLEWSGDYNITFTIPEHIAWQICELAEEEDNLWPCFSDDLNAKMVAFTEAVV